MSVQVRIPTVFRKYTNQQPVIEVQPGTVGGLIDQLEARHRGLKGQILAGEGELHRFVNIYLNDEDVRYLDGLDTKVSEGDTVSLLPSVAGGP